MFEKFFSEHAGDFRQRYEGTYGYYTDNKNNRFLAKISHVNLDSRPRNLEFINSKGVSFTLNADVSGDIGFDFLSPRSCLYNTKEGVYYVKRVAARQFQRGITGNNTQVYSITDRGFTPARVEFAALSAIFEQEIPLAEALKNFQDSWHSLAISKTFLLSKLGHVYLYSDPIGSFKLEEGIYKIKLSPGYEIFLTELQDSFNRAGIFNKEIICEKT